MKLKFGLGFMFILFLGWNANAQDKYGSNPEKCKTDLSIFYEYAKVQNYSAAYEPWKACLENCPASSLNIYKYGLLMEEDFLDKAAGILPSKQAGANVVDVEGVYYDLSKMNYAEFDKKGAEIDKLYEMRIKYFPENLGKVYSDWANSIFKRGSLDKRGTKVYRKDVYDKLSRSFKADPTGMSVKNLANYFQEYTDANKDTNPQAVFDTYDEITEAVDNKMTDYSKSLDQLTAKEAAGTTLSSKEVSAKKAAEVNLTALGQVNAYLDNTLTEVATCERLIPLYTSNFEKYKNDAVWLKRAVSRLSSKECTENSLYPKMVEAYVHAAPSSDAYVFYAGILLDNKQDTKAVEYFDKAIGLETDPYKKATYYYKMALIMKSKGNSSRSRELAYKALKERPSMGSAYLLISNLYASSANSCGTDEFSKRMVYVAAADKARKAKAVDPGITDTANRYISSYMANGPSTKLIFTEGKVSGTSYTVGCWIGETTQIP